MQSKNSIMINVTPGQRFRIRMPMMMELNHAKVPLFSHLWSYYVPACCLVPIVKKYFRLFPAK